MTDKNEQSSHSHMFRENCKGPPGRNIISIVSSMNDKTSLYEKTEKQR